MCRQRFARLCVAAEPPKCDPSVTTLQPVVRSLDAVFYVVLDTRARRIVHLLAGCLCGPAAVCHSPPRHFSDLRAAPPCCTPTSPRPLHSRCLLLCENGNRCSRYAAPYNNVRTLCMLGLHTCACVGVHVCVCVCVSSRKMKAPRNMAPGSCFIITSQTTQMFTWYRHAHILRYLISSSRKEGEDGKHRGEHNGVDGITRKRSFLIQGRVKPAGPRESVEGELPPQNGDVGRERNHEEQHVIMRGFSHFIYKRYYLQVAQVS